MTAPGRTLAEKIIARAAGEARVRPGDIVTCAVDLAMIHDSGGPRRVKPILERLGVKVWDPARVVLVSDHYVPAVDLETAAIQKTTRDWAAEQGVASFYDQQGICHVVLPERGHLRPGMFVVGGDSHSPTGGAFGCFMFGVGATDMAGVLATGRTWFRVPATMRITWSGALAEGVCAKDMALRQCAALGLDGAASRVVQFAGEAVAALPMHARMTLCNMSAEIGAQTALIEADAATAAFVAAAGGDPGAWAEQRGDADAAYDEEVAFDATALGPLVAVPHSPVTARPVEDAPPVRLDQCYIGACTGAKIDDLRMAARILTGRTVAASTRLLIAPASVRTTREAAAEGTLATLLEAGAILMPSGCGACAGYGAGVLAEREVCLASTARNFKGRMGAPSSEVYLGSPYTVAASAVKGRIADPRELLAERA